MTIGNDVFAALEDCEELILRNSALRAQNAYLHGCVTRQAVHIDDLVEALTHADCLNQQLRNEIGAPA